MKTNAGVRCDGCERIEDRNALASDRRPVPGSRDRFYDFVVPPSEIDPITKKPAKGKFRGIASQSDPNKLAALHACPGCAPKIQAAMKAKDPMMLPLGPLRVLMLEIKAKYGLKSLRIN